MKNNKGVTLVSLVVYIAIVFVVLAALMRITTYFMYNLNNSADVGFETEFNKLNLYLLDETKTIGNKIAEMVDGIEISFSSGNKFSYNKEEKAIYLNNNIKICSNVENNVFEQKTAENGRDILSITITINETTKTVEYVMLKEMPEEENININDYIWGEFATS